MNYRNRKTLTNPITSKEIQAVKMVINKSSGYSGFGTELYMNLREDITATFLIVFNEIESKGILPIFILEASISLMLKPDMYINTCIILYVHNSYQEKIIKKSKTDQINK